jgi:hypothetical protein
MAQAIKRLSSKRKALSSKPSATKIFLNDYFRRHCSFQQIYSPTKTKLLEVNYLSVVVLMYLPCQGM